MLQVVSKKVALDLINLYFGHSIYIYIYYLRRISVCVLRSRVYTGWVNKWLCQFCPERNYLDGVYTSLSIPNFLFFLLEAGLCQVQHRPSQQTPVAKTISLAEARCGEEMCSELPPAGLKCGWQAKASPKYSWWHLGLPERCFLQWERVLHCAHPQGHCCWELWSVSGSWLCFRGPEPSFARGSPVWLLCCVKYNVASTEYH